MYKENEKSNTALTFYSFIYLFINFFLKKRRKTMRKKRIHLDIILQCINYTRYTYNIRYHGPSLGFASVSPLSETINGIGDVGDDETDKSSV